MVEKGARVYLWWLYHSPNRNPRTAQEKGLWQTTSYPGVVYAEQLSHTCSVEPPKLNIYVFSPRQYQMLACTHAHRRIGVFV